MNLLQLFGADSSVPAGTDPGQVAARLDGVGLRVGGRWLIRHITLDLYAGELLVVVGPNGAGKSTVLSLLAGDVEPTEGTVSLTGSTLELARRRAVLPQQHLLSFPFTVGDIAAMGRAPWTGTELEDDDAIAVDTALEQTGMTAFAGRLLPTLSGGEQARAALARVLAQRAAIVLLDEPTAALDLRHQEDVMTIARDRAGAGDAVLAVVHDLQLAAAYADRLALLHDGSLVAVGPPADVLVPDRLSHVYGLPIRVATDADTGELVVAPVRAGRRLG
jgi:iron complex transport system ATP-binding protein